MIRWLLHILLRRPRSFAECSDGQKRLVLIFDAGNKRSALR